MSGGMRCSLLYGKLCELYRHVFWLLTPYHCTYGNKDG
jgi:hypothetical protein